MSATQAATAAVSDASASISGKLAEQSSASEAMKSLSSSIASASAALSSESKIAAGNLALPSFMKDLGIGLAVGSGLLIGASFVFKKKGLIAAQKKYNTQAGESMQYLKSPLWWCGMTMMILGEILNLVAYAVTSAVLVTPLGALSVVISAILSSIFLNEKLTLFGKIGCFLCIVGSTIIALNGPEQHAAGQIKEFQSMFLSVGFLVWGGICIAASLSIIFFVAPRYGKKYMLVYISVCSLIGGLSVSTISGIGSAIVLTIQGVNQFKHWFLYFLIGFVIITLLTEIVYLNKALELFNTAMVTPTYYVLFTFATLVTSIILFQGLDASAVQIVTIVLGFLTICAGITLLQLSKIDPDDLVDKEGMGLDRGSTLLIRASRSQIAHEKGHASALEDPGIDTVRGGLGVIGSIVRARSSRRIHSSSDQYQEMTDEHGSRMKHGVHGLNTMNKMDLERYELHDRPMPGSPGQIHSTVPAIHLQMPAKRDTAISFASGSEEPHGHHDRRSNTYDSQLSSRDITSPTNKGNPSGGILLSPTTSSTGQAGRSRFPGETSHLADIVEASQSTNSGFSAGTSIRVVGPRPATTSKTEGKNRQIYQQSDLRTMWDPSTQMGPDDTLEVASSAMAVAPSPDQRNEDGRFNYVPNGFDDSIDVAEDENTAVEADDSIAVRRIGGGSRTLFSSHGKGKQGSALGDEIGDDESEGLLSPQMQDALRFDGEKTDSKRSTRSRRR